MSEPHQTILRALQQYRGDDLERAKLAFRSYSPWQMTQPYGLSDKTPEQILLGYQEHVDEVEAAIRWVKQQEALDQS